MSNDQHWQRDPRSRAMTRGILMALARKRDWYFHASYLWSTVWGVLSLETWPVLLQSYRFDRFCRLEWNQYHAVAQWLTRVAPDTISNELEAFADGAAKARSKRVAVRLFVATAALIAAIAFIDSVDLGLLLKTAFWPQSGLRTALAFNAALSVAWLVHLLTVIRQMSRTGVWTGRFNELLAANERRPLPSPPTAVPWLLFVIAFVLLLVGPTWLAMMFVAIGIQNRYTKGTRAVRLAILERMLEWMDTSGLPVEFDIEEIEPEELVAMT